MKILVTGAKGMLGSDVCSVLGERNDVFGYDIEDFDITDAERVSDAVLEVAPSVIVHTAGFTDVEACEEKREKALQINVTGAGNVAVASSKAGSLLIYLSTDYVFGGSKRSPYKEMDTPDPINYYGITKLEGEKSVRELASRHLIVRTSWLFGPNGRNFVDTILDKASRGGSLRVVNDQRGCPTYTLDLARGIKSLIDSGLEGVVHLTNSGDATWFDLAGYAVRLAGLDVEIEPVESSRYPTKARRPPYSVLASDVIENAGIEPLPRWEEGVKDHIARRGLLKDEGKP